MNYRVHRAGTIHCLAGCCQRGKKIKEGNFFEVYNYDEAVDRLNAKNIVPHSCPFSNWSADEERKKQRGKSTTGKGNLK